jgi:DNA-binding transcriptional LysR family regulator
MQSVLELSLLRSFRVVAAAGSISLAAERVGRTQSALTMQMQRLEDIVGQPLLHRGARGVWPTFAGERLLAHAERMLALNEEALADLSGENFQGSVKFGLPEDYAVGFLPPLLRSFGARHPGVELEVVCAPSVQLREMLGRHKLHLALVSIVDAGAPEAIRPEPLVWVGSDPAGYDRREMLTLALGEPDAIDHRAARAALDGAGEAYRISYASRSLTGLIAVVRSGQAISVLTRTAVPRDLYIIGEGLPPLPMIGISLMTDETARSRAAEAFGAHVRESLPLF